MRLKAGFLVYIPMFLIMTYWGYIKVALPVLPNLLQAFNTSGMVIHQLISLSFILAGLSSIIWGVVIDRLEMQRFLVYITVIGILVLSSVAFTHNIYWWGMTYILSSIIVGGFLVCSRSFVMLYLQNDLQIKKSLSMLMVGGYSSAFLVPFISGWLGSWLSWRYAFLVIPVWLIVLFIIFSQLHSQPEHQQTTKTLRDNIQQMISHLKNKRFRTCLLIIAGCSAVAQSYYIAIAFWLLPAYHVSVQHVAFYLFPILLPGIIMPFFGSAIQQRFSELSIIAFYVALLILAGVLSIGLMWVPHPSSWLWVIPGVLASLTIVGMLPIISFHALQSVTGHYSAASGLIAIAAYSSAGVGIFITSFIRLQDFYKEGVFMLIIALWVIMLLKKIYKKPTKQ
ncbi:multidrug resistance protein D [Piscirickettsia salmonis]|uniref:MFS transporter n=1 Tax=Piscirickettsia salmonis TaxID=1238 RepID=UPI0012BB10B0|nr:MFS transporter [Piscirickettsia salmonis]QGP54664.1 multidrug resistance protein D [Piscirickettsia salmonis]QGP59439.1 multidrug resistance protein D [Piscirickettsia salmonis]QGP64139.1 multidrug resistance protein D [Piscirickettsia salmonis]